MQVLGSIAQLIGAQKNAFLFLYRIHHKRTCQIQGSEGTSKEVLPAELRCAAAMDEVMTDETVKNRKCT